MNVNTCLFSSLRATCSVLILPTCVVGRRIPSDRSLGNGGRGSSYLSFFQDLPSCIVCSVVHKNSCFMYLSDSIVHSKSHSGANFSESIN